ncbi:MAG: U32 family peptidase, partial [Erysipelotrichaceae bacterium]|nr:U32 family peptidase [Erysipelotrichaceae bacterium]
MELLAPSGSKEALVAAVQSGADAVYLGGKMYGARANAANFSMEELAWVMAYCRKYGVRVYVTVNTLIFDDEFEELFAYVDQLVELHVDALILQDTGVAVALRQRYPDLPLHASTQMHLHNVKQVEWAKTLGFTRVVAARETPLHIVTAMVQTGMEIETFVHGALCV